MGISSLSLTGHSENTFYEYSRPSSLQARGSCGKGSSCNYITLIYGRQRKDGERMETELPWRQSKIRSLKKHKSIGLHHKTWWIGDNCVGMNVVRETLATRWGQTDLKWWKRTKLWKTATTVIQEVSWWTCSWSTNKFRNTISKSLNSGGLMTTVLLMLLMLC